MTKQHPRNIAASVRQRLLNRSKEIHRPFNELLQRFGNERFIYRLSRTSHADQFVLKGALMFTAWKTPVSRPTKDIDLLGRIDNSIETIVGIMKDACDQKVEPDGVIFNAVSVEGTTIMEDADYAGVRIRLYGHLDNARIAIQIDIGFGDVVSPAPRKITYPTILDFPAPKLKGYSRESTIAEKFLAMVKLRELNSRMKDFYDIWLLSRQFDFKGQTLATAIRKTFANRKIKIPSRPMAFEESFGRDQAKKTQWQAFIHKSKLEDVSADFADVVQTIRKFLGPIAESLSGDNLFTGDWIAPGPWQVEKSNQES